MQVCWPQMLRTIQPAMVYMGWLRLLFQRYGLVFDPEYFVLNQCRTRLILNYAVCKRISLLLLYLVYQSEALAKDDRMVYQSEALAKDGRGGRN